nr:transient receptor potential cation channel subfamily M member 2-like [Dermatophagoides farinae]
MSNISRVSSRIDQTFKQFATRVQVANKLSKAKRKEENMAINAGTLLEEPSCRTKSIKKIQKQLSPFIQQQQQQSKQFYHDQDGNVKEGVISGGNLVFDVDYPLSISDSKRSISRPYIYLTADVEMKNITEILFDEWHVSMPRIALFLLSDPDHFRTWNNPRQMASFRTGVMKAAKTTSMWLVTNGLDIGVGKLIGDALIEEQNEMQTYRSSFEKSRKHFPIIGITNDFNLSYTQEFFGPNIQLSKPGPIPNQRRYELNPMHTNFIVLQSSNSDDCYHNLMINLIDHLTKRTISSTEQLYNDNDNDDHDHHYRDSNIPPQFRSHYIPSSGDRQQSNIIRRRRKMHSSSKKLPQKSQQQQATNLDIIVRPSYGQKTNCFGYDQDMVDAESDDDDDDNSDDEKFDEDQHSFISPEGTVVYEDDVSGARPMSPMLENDSRSMKETNEKMIPVVCLVIQGDYHCAKLVLDNIRRRNPIIVLRGSGGFADLLSYAYIEMQHRCRDLYHAWDAEFVEQTLKPLLVQKIVKQFPEFRNNAMARNTFRDRIIECVRESGSPRGRVYLSILNMHNSSCDLTNLSEFILLSLFKSQHRRDKLDSSLIRKDLYLTLDWNCPLVALDEVLSRNPSYNLQLEKSIFELAVLKSNREDFVDLFLTHGFKIHKYLTPFRLIRLIRYSLLESDFFRTVCMEAILGVPVWSDNFEELLGRLASPSHSNIDPEKFISNEFNQLIFTTTSLHNFVSPHDMCLNIMGMYQVDAGSSERKALATLAMWAVFNRRFKLAEILWKHSDQPIHLGLILSMILDRMAWFVSEQNIKDDLQNESKIFAKFAIDVLDACYRNDEQRGYDLLDQKNSDWDQQTAVDIAANGSHRAFIAHPCCQKWLTNTFNGRIRVRELSWGFLTIPPVIKIIVSAFFILPMYIWIRFLDTNHKWTEYKTKLLEEFNQADDSNDSNDDDDEFLAKAVDELKLIPLNSDHKAIDERRRRNPDENVKKSNINLNEQLFDNQLTISSLDDKVRAALTRWNRKRQKHYGHHRTDQERGSSSKNKSSYDRERNNLFIDKQPPLFKMINLLWNSPITKFWTYHVFYIIYLALLSLALIWPGCGEWRLDLTVCVWTFLNIIEHIRRVYVLYRRYTSVPMFFRILESILLIIFWLTYTWGRVLIVYSYSIHGHLFSRYNIDPYTMKVILSAGLLYFYYRLFYIYLPISPTLGPLLYRFKLMVSVDFIHFMRMALILLISSGIIIQALLYPNTELSREMFHKAIHRSIVSLFTTPVDELTRNCTIKPPKHLSTTTTTPKTNDADNTFKSMANLTSIFLQTVILGTESLNEPINREELCPVKPIPMSQSCPVSGFWSYAFTFQFLICLKLILMTLLYALFASTATKLQTETDNIWKYQRYILVIDFANRPALHAPLSLFKYGYVLLKFWYNILTFPCNCCRNRLKKKNNRIGDTIDSSREGVFLVQDDNGNDGSSGSGDNYKKRLSKEDYNYWRHLAKAIYDEQQRKEDEKDVISKQTDTIQLICEELEHEKTILRTIKTKMNEFERMMYQTQICLETIKHIDTSSANVGGVGIIGDSCQTLLRPKQQQLHKRTIATATTTIQRSTTMMDLTNQSQIQAIGLHYLARLSPYAGTRIQRFPVADKFVSWDIIWINYDPVIYSRKRENFPTSLKKWVDEDLLAVKERLKTIVKRSFTSSNISSHLPVFNWNAVSVNPAGLTIDRRSWIKEDLGAWDLLDCNLSPKIMATNEQPINNLIIYKLDEDGIPLNVWGRTGLRGKGNLPRWGPNHYVMLLVSRTRIINGGGGQIHAIHEFALERKYSSLFAPMRFIGDDIMFSDLRQLFRTFDKNSIYNKWNNDNDLLEYFRSIDPQIKSVIPAQAYYMDSPDNTDNGWKEVKIYHFHFNDKIDWKLTDTMITRDDDQNDDMNDGDYRHSNCPSSTRSQLSWISYNEDMLVQMPMEQVQFIDNAIRMINTNWI